MAGFIFCKSCIAWDNRSTREGDGYCCKEDSGNFLMYTLSDDGCTEGVKWGDEGIGATD